MRQFLFFILITLVTPSIAQLAVVNDQHDEHIFPLNELTYLIDQSDTLSIGTASAPAFAGNFLRHGSYQNTDFQFGAAYWIRMPVQHSSKSQKQWIFEF